jgi:Na+/melibiose symporter-like transporter
VVDGATQLIDQPQSDQFVLALRLIFMLVPLILLSLAIFVASRLKLTHQSHARLNRVLAARRAGEELDSDLQADAEELKKLLIG